MVTAIFWILLATSIHGDQLGKAFETKEACHEARQQLVADSRTAAVSECIPIQLKAVKPV